MQTHSGRRWKPSGRCRGSSSRLRRQLPWLTECRSKHPACSGVHCAECAHTSQQHNSQVIAAQAAGMQLLQLHRTPAILASTCITYSNRNKLASLECLSAPSTCASLISAGHAVQMCRLDLMLTFLSYCLQWSFCIAESSRRKALNLTQHALFEHHAFCT